MKTIGATFMRIILVTTSTVLAGCASDSVVKPHRTSDDSGTKAYLDVVLMRQGPKIECHAVIAGAGTAVHYSEIELHVFDQNGKPIRFSPVFPGLTDVPVANTTAHAIYYLTPKADQRPRSATLAWGGTTRRVEPLVWLGDEGK